MKVFLVYIAKCHLFSLMLNRLVFLCAGNLLKIIICDKLVTKGVF